MTKTLSISSKKEKDRILCREVKGQQREGFLININIAITIIINITTTIAIALHLEQGIKCLNRYWATVSKENRRLLNRSPLKPHICFVIYSFTPLLCTSFFHHFLS